MVILEGVKCNLSCKNPYNDPKRLMNSFAACSCVPDRIEIWSTQRKLLGATGNDSLTLFILLATKKYSEEKRLHSGTETYRALP